MKTKIESRVFASDYYRRNATKGRVYGTGSGDQR